MNYDPVNVGMRIKNMREKMGLSQEEYSEQLNISRNHHPRIEVGLRSASIEILIAISELSNTTIDYLVMGKEPDNKKVKANIRTVVSSLIKIEQEL